MDNHPSAICREVVNEWESRGLIEYVGETADVRPYLADCTVFVLPSSYREGLPQTILEAMSVGRAVVTTDTPGCHDAVVDGINGFLVPVRDSGALAAAMGRFIRTRSSLWPWDSAAGNKPKLTSICVR